MTEVSTKLEGPLSEAYALMSEAGIREELINNQLYQAQKDHKSLGPLNHNRACSLADAVIQYLIDAGEDLRTLNSAKLHKAFARYFMSAPNKEIAYQEDERVLPEGLDEGAPFDDLNDTFQPEK